MGSCKGLKRFVCVTATISLKHRRFDEKGATKSTFVRTHREAQYTNWGYKHDKTTHVVKERSRELTLKCKLKCYLNPRITHWALAPVMGNREPHEAKKKSFDLGGNRTHDLRIRSTVTLPTELQGRTEKVGDDSRWRIAAKRKQSNGKVTVDLIRKSWVRFPPRSKDFFFASCGSML